MSLLALRHIAEKLRPLSNAFIVSDSLRPGRHVKVFWLNKWFRGKILENCFETCTTRVLWEKEEPQTYSILSWSSFGAKKNASRDSLKMAWRLCPSQRTHIGVRKRLQIMEEQNWCCKTCSVPLSSSSDLDHVLPLFLGSSEETPNLQYLCSTCHKKKTSKESRLRKRLRKN